MRSGTSFNRLLAILTIGVLALSACQTGDGGPSGAESPGAAGTAGQQTDGGAADDGGVPRPDTLVFEMDTGPESLDQAQLFDPYANYVGWNVYESLLTYDGNSFEVVPNLATEWEVSEDGRQWTFQLQEGVTFHDGTPFNAEAVKFSIERIIGMAQSRGGFSYYNGVLQGISDWAAAEEKNAENFEEIVGGANAVEVVDEFTVRFNLEQPYPPFEHMMALPFISAIISPTAVEDQGGVTYGETSEYFNTHMVGTGPYELANYDVGSSTAELQAFGDYWGGPDGDVQPSIQTVVVQPVEDPLTRTLNLQAGESDMAIIPTNQIFQFADEARWRESEELESRVDGVTVEGPFELNRIEAIGLNTQIRDSEGDLVDFQPFQDERVRRAFGHAFDQEAYIQDVLRGFGTPVGGPVPSTFEGHTEIAPLEFDLDQAQSLLEEAGAELGFGPDNVRRVTFVFPAGEQESEAAMLQLASNINGMGVGLEVNVVPQAYSAFVSQYLNRSLDTLRISWVGAFPDADGNLTAFGDSEEGILAQAIGFEFSDIDELIDQQRTERDEERRIELIQEASEAIADTNYYVWRAQRLDYFAHRDWLSGYFHHPAYVGPYLAALSKG